jgi:hypothetical protein
MRETVFETLLIDSGLGPDERLGVSIVGLDEGVDVLSELFDRGEGCAAERLALQDREPDFDLGEPGCPRRREVELDIRMPLGPELRNSRHAAAAEREQNRIAWLRSAHQLGCARPCQAREAI